MREFFVDVVVLLYGPQAADDCKAAEVLRRVRFDSPSVAVRIVSGPELLPVGVRPNAEESSELRLGVEGNAEFGPGTLRRGETYSIDTDGDIRGLVKILRISPIGADPTDHASWKELARRVMEVNPSAGTVTCPSCGVAFELKDRNVWTSVRHRVCGQKLRLAGVENQIEPVWALVGNIVGTRPYGEDGTEHRSGTKHFSPGTKVYCFPALWGDGYERVRVIGKHRGSRHMAVMIINSSWITNKRAKLVYSPAIVDKLSGYWDGTAKSQELAEHLASFPDPSDEQNSSAAFIPLSLWGRIKKACGF